MTVTAVRGHAPREAGAKMVVSARELLGQHRRRQPRGSLRCSRPASCWPRAAGSPRPGPGASPTRRRPEHGVQCCGGEVTVLLEPLRRRARGGDLRDRPRRLRAGPDPGPARPRAAPGRLPRASSSSRSGWPRSPPTPWPGCTPTTRRAARAGARRAAGRQPRAGDDPRPRRGRRAVRRRAALRTPRLDRPDRLLGEVAPVRASGWPRRGTTRRRWPGSPPRSGCPRSPARSRRPSR